jgi:hypothetical protein
MPQFDTLIFYSQAYWLTTFFFILYSLISQMYLPRLALAFKIRRIVLNDLFGSSSDYFLNNLKSNLRSLFFSSMLLTSILENMSNILSLESQEGLASDISKIVSCYIQIYLTVPTSSSTILSKKV